MGKPHIDTQHCINSPHWHGRFYTIFDQQRGVVFPCYRARQSYALELSVQLPVNPCLNRFHLRHFDPVVTHADAHTVVTGLLPMLTLELRVTRWELWIKEGLEGFIEIDARLL